jgi:hypothetical protein
VRTVYCYDWNRQLQQPRDVYTEDEARARHDAGQLYSQLTFDDNDVLRRKVRLRLEAQSARVDHRDERGRTTLSYGFYGIEDGRIFLNEVFISAYADDGAKAFATTSYRFSRDGTLVINEGLPGQGTPARNRRTKLKDLSILWEPVPAFGDYESIARVEREMPGANGSVRHDAGAPRSD